MTRERNPGLETLEDEKDVITSWYLLMEFLYLLFLLIFNL